MWLSPDLGDKQGVGLVDLPQPVQHLGELWWIDRLHSYLDSRLSVKLQGMENLGLREGEGRMEGGSLSKGIAICTCYRTIHFRIHRSAIKLYGDTVHITGCMCYKEQMTGTLTNTADAEVQRSTQTRLLPDLHLHSQRSVWWSLSWWLSGPRPQWAPSYQQAHDWPRSCTSLHSPTDDPPTRNEHC